MGNHCCTFREPKVEKSHASQHNTITVVVAAEGRVVQVEMPSAQASMKVGELLLEFPPAHFVAHFYRSSFHLDPATPAASPRLLHQRPSPLGADADAMPGAAHVYLLFPMPRLHTRLTPQDHLTFARLLHNHAMSDHDQQRIEDNLAKSAPADVLLRRSHAKRVCSSMWRQGGAARVAPHDDVDQELQESTSLTKTSIMRPEPVEVGGTDHEEEEELHRTTQLVPKWVMMKAKPWAARLETISEGRHEG